MSRMTPSDGSDRKPKAVVLLDVDGCLLSMEALYTFLLQNQGGHYGLLMHSPLLAAELKGLAAMRDVTIAVGSNRQDMSNDHSQGFSKEFKVQKLLPGFSDEDRKILVTNFLRQYSCFPHFSQMSEDLGVHLDQFLLADIFAERQDGETFRDAESRNAEYPELKSSDFVSECPSDEKKILLIYAHLHRAALNGATELYFYDDRADILKVLLAFFSENKSLVPSGMTLYLRGHGATVPAVGETKEMVEEQSIQGFTNSHVVGSGEIDFHYKGSLHRVLSDSYRSKSKNSVEGATSLDLINGTGGIECSVPFTSEDYIKVDGQKSALEGARDSVREKVLQALTILQRKLEDPTSKMDSSKKLKHQIKYLAVKNLLEKMAACQGLGKGMTVSFEDLVQAAYLTLAASRSFQKTNRLGFIPRVLKSDTEIHIRNFLNQVGKCDEQRVKSLVDRLGGEISLNQDLINGPFGELVKNHIKEFIHSIQGFQSMHLNKDVRQKFGTLQMRVSESCKINLDTHGNLNIVFSSSPGNAPCTESDEHAAWSEYPNASSDDIASTEDDSGSEHLPTPGN